MPLRRLFALTSVAFLLVLAISPAKNALRPYRAFQRRFAALGAARAKSARQAHEYETRPVAIQPDLAPGASTIESTAARPATSASPTR